MITPLVPVNNHPHTALVAKLTGLAVHFYAQAFCRSAVGQLRLARFFLPLPRLVFKLDQLSSFETDVPIEARNGQNNHQERKRQGVGCVNQCLFWGCKPEPQKFPSTIAFIPLCTSNLVLDTHIVSRTACSFTASWDSYNCRRHHKTLCPVR